MSVAELIDSSGVVLITTPGCTHCRRVSAVIEEASGAFPTVTCQTLSAPDRPDIAERLGVRAAPTVLAFHQAREVDRIVGPANRQEIVRVFDAASGALPKTRSTISAENRVLRTVSASVLLVAAVIASSLSLGVGGALLVMSGWHDRLPTRHTVRAAHPSTQRPG